MKLYAAPLQGFTEAPWRNLHQEVFGGIDAYYTPFVRMEKGEFRNKDVREIASENNTVSRLIPQLIASTPAELERLAGLFIEKGYKEADINMGCPFPLMTGKHKGSGIFAVSGRGGSFIERAGALSGTGFLRQDEIGMGVCG